MSASNDEPFLDSKSGSSQSIPKANSKARSLFPLPGSCGPPSLHKASPRQTARPSRTFLFQEVADLPDELTQPLPEGDPGLNAVAYEIGLWRKLSMQWHQRPGEQSPPSSGNGRHVCSHTVARPPNKMSANILLSMRRSAQASWTLEGPLM